MRWIVLSKQQLSFSFFRTTCMIDIRRVPGSLVWNVLNQALRHQNVSTQGMRPLQQEVFGRSAARVPIILKFVYQSRYGGKPRWCWRMYHAVWHGLTVEALDSSQIENWCEIKGQVKYSSFRSVSIHSYYTDSLHIPSRKENTRITETGKTMEFQVGWRTVEEPIKMGMALPRIPPGTFGTNTKRAEVWQGSTPSATRLGTLTP